MQREVQERLDSNGWEGRSQVLVLDPELEVWVWSDSPHMARVLGASDEELAEVRKAYPADPPGKPSRPKEAMEEVLRRSHIPRSSALYGELAQNVSLRRCADAAFQQLRVTLKNWFPP